MILKDFYEKREWSKNQLICGIDEVGRGCLAGPLITCAVILYPNFKHELLLDSKILSKNELFLVYPEIIKNSWFSLGIIDNILIDKINIYNSTILGMKKAVFNLFATCPKLPSITLIDAMPLSLKKTIYENIEIQYFPKGETLSSSIAAASIIAKVNRDLLMEKYDKLMPGYDFAKHKGYGTSEHQNSISINGTSILHRNTFLNNLNHISEEKTLQNSIFVNNIEKA